MPEALDGYEALPPLSSERVTRFAQATDVLEDGRDYRTLVQTNRGEIVLELHQSETPVTVNNFGRVLEGLEVLDSLTKIDPNRPGGTTPDRMERVTVYAR